MFKYVNQLKIEKEWESNGLKCLVVANTMGHRCGYVGVPKEHPLFGKGYDEINDINVHGGLTFASGATCFPDNTLWYFGFDCAHLGDAKDPSIMDADGLNAYQISNKWELVYEKGTIKTTEYCIAECNKLACQLNNYKWAGTHKCTNCNCHKEESNA